MALQTVITGDNGLDISYWRITNGAFGYDGSSADLRFTLAGYKDAEWRAKGANAKSYTMHAIVAGGPESGLGPTGGAAVPSDFPQSTSGDLRPALYAWIKTQTAWNDMGRQAQTVDWSAATDV
tara:strand:- start:310 stop:678 length:369 start_codon:yes stop_codon:yes gene_type:complete